MTRHDEDDDDPRLALGLVSRRRQGWPSRGWSCRHRRLQATP